MGALVINVLVPFKIHLAPFLFAVVAIAVASEPACGSVNPKLPMTSPDIIPGKYFSFCLSLPNSRIGIPHSPQLAPADKKVAAHAFETSSPAIAKLIRS